MKAVFHGNYAKLSLRGRRPTGSPIWRFFHAGDPACGAVIQQCPAQPRRSGSDCKKPPMPPASSRSPHKPAASPGAGPRGAPRPGNDGPSGKCLPSQNKRPLPPTEATAHGAKPFPLSIPGPSWHLKFQTPPKTLWVSGWSGLGFQANRSRPAGCGRGRGRFRLCRRASGRFLPRGLRRPRG